MNHFEPHRIEKYERRGNKEVIVDIADVNGRGRIRAKFLETEDRKPKINIYSYESVKEEDRRKFILFETKMDEMLPLQFSNLKPVHIASELASKHDLVEKSAELEKEASKEVNA